MRFPTRREVGSLVVLLVSAAIFFSVLAERRSRAWPNQGGTNWWYLPSTSPVMAPGWTTAQWYVDPSNATGCASDGNTGTCAGCNTCGHNFAGDGPLLTWHELNDHRWSCLGGSRNCPRLQQSTAITFLSSHTDNTDPIYFYPALEKGAVSQITAALPTPTCTGTLASVTAKNVTTPQLLKVTLCGGLAPGALVVNSTHSSVAWTYATAGGNAWNMTQPLVPSTVPQFPPSAEVNTWANGDTFTAYAALTAVNVVDVNPTQADLNAVQFDNSVYLYRIKIFDPANVGTPVYLRTTYLLESSTMRNVQASGVEEYEQSGALNAWNPVGYTTNVSSLAGYWYHAGALTPTAGISAINVGPASVDGDFIDSFGMGFQGVANINSLYVESGHTAITTNLVTTGTIAGGDGQPGVIWGPGGFSAQGSGAHIQYVDAGALWVLNLQIAGAAKACSQCSGNGLTFGTFPINCGITLSASNLKAACGDAGFGGTAFIPGSGTWSPSP